MMYGEGTMSGAAAQDVVTLTDALSVDTKLTVHDAVRTLSCACSFF